MEQRVLDNARFLWSRVVEKNRREVEERAEQLKAVSNLAALIAGFALIAFLEFSIEPEEEARGLVIGFGLTTALTVRAYQSLFLCFGQPQLLLAA